MEMEYEVVVVGAGIAGLACATALHRAGVRRFLLLDKDDSIRSEGKVVLLYPSGWYALEALGVAGRLANIYRTCDVKKQTNLETGETKETFLTSTMDRRGIGVRAVHRSMLRQVLAEELPRGHIRFDSKLVRIKREQALGPSSSGFTELQFDDGSTIRTKVLIGCDGVHSQVAHWLGLSQAAASERSIIRGLADFNGGHNLSNELQEYILKDRRGAYVPVTDKEVYWYIAHDSKPRDFEKTMHPRRLSNEVTLHLAEGFPDYFLNIIRHSDTKIITRTYQLYRSLWGLLLGCFHRNLVTVAGDAFHPIASDLSFGSCMALEDAVILARHIRSHMQNQHDLKKAIGAYVKERRQRVAALVIWSYLSFWAHHSWSEWGFLGRLIRFFGDKLYYWFVKPRIVKTMNYDCRGLSSGNN